MFSSLKKHIKSILLSAENMDGVQLLGDSQFDQKCSPIMGDESNWLKLCGDNHSEALKLLDRLGFKTNKTNNHTCENIQEVINKMEQKRNPGELYSLGSKKIFYQAVGSGLYKSAVPEFEKQTQ